MKYFKKYSEYFPLTLDYTFHILIRISTIFKWRVSLFHLGLPLFVSSELAIYSSFGLPFLSLPGFLFPFFTICFSVFPGSFFCPSKSPSPSSLYHNVSLFPSLSVSLLPCLHISLIFLLTFEILDIDLSVCIEIYHF